MPPWSSTATRRWVAWCQYGSPEELPGIYHRKEWEAGLTGEPPAYRITCIFVDRDHGREGVAAAAVRGALDLIAKAGGGMVEGYPHDLQGEKIRSQFLYSATRSLFEEIRFSYERPKGKEELRDAQNRFTRRTVLTGSRREKVAKVAGRAACRPGSAGRSSQPTPTEELRRRAEHDHALLRQRRPSTAEPRRCTCVTDAKTLRR